MTREERDLSLSCDESELDMACRVDFRKSSGHGGQKVNKTSSAVRLFHDQSGISVSCMEYRSQLANRREALKKLRFFIACNVRCEPDPSFSFAPVPSRSGRLYALWTAKFFDVLAGCSWNVKTAAAAFGVSRSSIEKTLRADPALYREFTIRRERKAADDSE